MSIDHITKGLIMTFLIKDVGLEGFHKTSSLGKFLFKTLPKEISDRQLQTTQSKSTKEGILRVRN
jgi:hypothetical protein